MANLIQQIHKSNHVRKSSFDLSGNVNYTSCPGMLLPIRFDDCLPNSTYSYQLSTFARTIQMIVPSFARVKAHFDAFFVPYRILGDDYQSIIVGDTRGMAANYLSGTYSDANQHLPTLNMTALFPPDTGNKPNFGSLSDAAGISYNVSSPILFNALGYGVDSFGVSIGSNLGRSDKLANDGAIASSVASSVGSNNLLRSILPLQAYQKIYQDFYRNKLWELENRASYFCFASDDSKDFTVKGRTNGLFEMRYHDYDKDRIFGVVPDTNNILSVGISQYASSVLNGIQGLDASSSLGSSQAPLTDVSSVNSKGVPGSPLSSLDNIDLSNYNQNVAQGKFDSASVIVQQYTALTNRRMEAFQKFAEITSMNKSDYKHQIQAHFGFSVPAIDTDYVQFIGGYDMPLNISDVENTSNTNQGYLAGKGVLNGNSNTFSVSPQEHGCVMIICYIVPQVDWSNVFIDRSTLRFNRYDFAIPEFDTLGFEPVRVLDVCSDLSFSGKTFDPGAIIGYLPRYWSYKTKLDVNMTGFSADDKQSLNFDSYIVKYDRWRLIDNLKAGTMYKAFKSLPGDLNGLFAVNWSKVQDNPFVFTTYISCRATLPLSVDSLPY